MTDPEDKLPVAIREEENDFTEALQEANDILYPDPAKALAAAISERKTAVREWKDCLKRCDALTADLDAIHGMVGRPAVPVVEAVRRYCNDEHESKNELRSARDAASRWIGQIAVALGLSEYAPAVAVRDRAKDLRAEVERLTALLATAEKDAETQRTAAADLRAALDRVAAAAGVESDSTASIVADLVVDAIRRLSRDRDQVRVARKDAIEDLERLNEILSSAGIDTTGPAADVADRVAAALLRPALPADLPPPPPKETAMDDKNTATTTENNTVTRMQAAVDAVSVECSPAHADRLRAAWAETQELLRGWQAIAAGYQEERNRALDALDRIDTAIDEHKTLLAAALVGSRDGSVTPAAAAHAAQLNRWLALPTAEVKP